MRYSLPLFLLLGAFGAGSAWSQSLPPPSRAALTAEARVALQALQFTPAQRMELQALLLEAQALRALLQEEVDVLFADAAHELAQPDADLRALAAQKEAVLDARLANLRALRDDFLNFYYDDLDPTQQTQVRALLLARVERIERVRGALSELRTAFLGD